ncbi:hypothetical protein [Ruegeria sp. A3M17]|uniref:hypothetical protein n=1 Tax=Ruegeria sp. A3M17 TaxID=2267229 RepID=UPI000DE86AD5|nr:hypothetical protein [Ruegeria sp. A3M17]RBW56082.1 hypothetical protein DS906_13815 [Ruegeria sp. A3M17]
MKGRAAKRKAAALSVTNLGAEQMPFEPIRLYRVLQFRIDTADTAARRAKWAGGRLFNLLSGQSTQFIPLYGTHVRQVLSAAGQNVPDGIVPAKRYELRLDYAKRAYTALMADLDQAK